MSPETGSKSGPRGWREALLVLVVVALGGLLRQQVAERTFPVGMFGDERYYAKVANTLSRGRQHFYDGLGGPAYAWRPPAHSWALSKAVDRDLAYPEYQWPLVQLEVLLGTALVAATWLLGRALFGARTALLAATATAVSPILVAFSHYLWSEMMFASLVTTGLALIAFQQRRSSWVLAALAGVVMGVAALTRELAIGVAGVGAIWWVITAPPEGRRRAVLMGTTMLLGVAAVVVPWTVRNHAVLDRFVPVATVGWFATGEGNILDDEDWLHARSPDEEGYRQRYFEIPDEMRRAGYARKYALRRIGEEQPTWILKKFVRSTATLLSPDSFLFEKLRRGLYEDVDLSRVRQVVWSALAFYAVALILGAAGLAVAGDFRQRLLAWMVLGSVLGVHVLANASTRFRVPWWPLIFVFASHLVLHPRVLIEARKWRWILVVAVALLFASLLAPEFFAGLDQVLGEGPRKLP